MHSLDGQRSWNFFKNNFSTHIPRITRPLLGVAGQPLLVKFATATKNIQQVQSIPFTMTKLGIQKCVTVSDNSNYEKLGI